MAQVKSDKVWAEYDWKRMILYLHAMTNDELENYLRLKYNEHTAMKVYDMFLAKMARLYTDIRPKLMKRKDDTIKNIKIEDKEITVGDLIEVMDAVKMKRTRLHPDHAIKFFDVFTQFLEEWGLTAVEAPDQ